MTLEQRVEKAKKLTFVSVLSDGTEVGTWGSKDDFYRVKVTKRTERTIQINQRHITVEKILVKCCQIDGDCNCEGNSHWAICYHAIGALMFVLDKRGQEIEFCRDEFIASGTVERDEWDRTKNNSHFAIIQSKQSHGSMWAVIRDKTKKSVDHGDMENRIRSLRGIEEKGID